MMNQKEDESLSTIHSIENPLDRYSDSASTIKDKDSIIDEINEDNQIIDEVMLEK